MQTTMNLLFLLLTVLLFTACNEVNEAKTNLTTETTEQRDTMPPPAMSRQMEAASNTASNEIENSLQVVTGTLKEGSGIESECYLSIEVEEEVLNFFYVYKTFETNQFEEITITGKDAPQRLIIQDEDINLLLDPQFVGKSVKVTYEPLSSEAVREKFGFDLMMGSDDGQERLIHTIELL